MLAAAFITFGLAVGWIGLNSGDIRALGGSCVSILLGIVFQQAAYQQRR